MPRCEDEHNDDSDDSVHIGGGGYPPKAKRRRTGHTRILDHAPVPVAESSKPSSPLAASHVPADSPGVPADVPPEMAPDVPADVPGHGPPGPLEFVADPETLSQSGASDVHVGAAHASDGALSVSEVSDHNRNVRFARRSWFLFFQIPNRFGLEGFLGYEIASSCAAL